jgi:hypothetical protein
MILKSLFPMIEVILISAAGLNKLGMTGLKFYIPLQIW